VRQKLPLAEELAPTRSVLGILKGCSDSANRIPYAKRGACASAAR
jgi:hypothetical protein